MLAVAGVMALGACAGDRTTAKASGDLESAESSPPYLGLATEFAGSVAEVASACPRRATSPMPTVAPADQVFVCTTSTRRVPGDGEWMFAQIRRATEGVPRLFESYAARDARRTNGACTADRPDPRVVWLHVTPIRAIRAPRDSCGKPTVAASAAYDAMTTEVVAEVRVRQQASEAAVSSGCGQHWKDMLAIDGSGSPIAGTVGVPVPLDGEVRLCRYSVHSNSQGDTDGDLVAGAHLEADRVSAINAALARSIADLSCRSAPGREFAVLLPGGGGGGETYVALDGCAVHQGKSWWRAAPELAALLR